MAEFLERRMILGAKKESVEGTAEAPVGADCNLLVEEVKFEADVDQFDRKPISDTLSPYASIAGMRKAKLTCKVELKGSGSLGTPPALGTLLKACGFTETIVGSDGGLNQTAVGNVDNILRPAGGANNQQLAAQFTSAGETVTLAKLKLKRTGAIAYGMKIWVELQTDAAGAPSGIPVTGGVSDLVEAAGLATTYNDVRFSFPGSPVLAAAAHHAVLKGDYAASDTVNVSWRSKTVGSSGNFEAMTSGTWGDTATKDLEATVMQGTGVLYTPLSLGVDSLTIDVFSVPASGNHLRERMIGARGTWKITGKAGQPVYFECTFQGAYVAVSDQSGLTPSGLEATLPQAFLSTAFSMHGFSLHKVSTFGIDLGNTLAARTDIAAASGLLSYLIVDKKPTFSFDPEKELVATHDYYGKMLGNVEGALSVAVGAVAGNICTITAPKCQYTKVVPGSRDGLGILTVSGQMNRENGNDELQLSFS